VTSQEAVYASFDDPDLDRELSWSEHELGERERTKHVHRLHPYLGKFIPQLVEVCLHRHFLPGQRVLDPFAGSGTTLVECTTFGADTAGVDVSAFNVLLCRVKSARLDVAAVALALDEAMARLDGAEPAGEPTAYLQRWFSPGALDELLRYRSLIPADGDAANVMRIVLCRAARSARLAPHYNLESPRAPVTGPYWCHKHRRECQPTTEARKFLARYSRDTVSRLAAYAALRRDVEAVVHHADSRTVDLGALFDGLITSPPYPGRIDYHDQHRYAFDLLGLRGWEDREIGAPARGLSRKAIDAYCDDVAAVFANARRQVAPGSPMIIVIDDVRHLYDRILEQAGLTVVATRRRHVNRRTGRRDEGYYEAVIHAVA
jgi:hypothetical protein